MSEVSKRPKYFANIIARIGPSPVPGLFVAGGGCGSGPST